MKNIMIATPAYGGKVNVQYSISLMNTATLLRSNGIEVTPLLTASGSLLVAERNRIIEAFWNSDCTHLLCIDGDLGWPPEAVMAMLMQEKHFVAGIYPARGQQNVFIFRPDTNEDGSLILQKHLIKMKYIPAGFMLLSRDCIKILREKYPELYFEPKDEKLKSEKGYCFFNTEVYEGEFWGEDYVFCRRASEAGIEIWVDPLIQFDHDGTIGMLTDVLERREVKKDK